MQNMYVAEWSPQAGWLGNIKPYGPLQMMPSAQVSRWPVSESQAGGLSMHCMWAKAALSLQLLAGSDAC